MPQLMIDERKSRLLRVPPYGFASAAAAPVLTVLEDRPVLGLDRVLADGKEVVDDVAQLAGQIE